MQAEDFELPPGTPDEDTIVITNILAALMHIGKEHKTCLTTGYKVETINVGYLLRALLPTTDTFEFSLEDLLLLHALNPARVDGVNVCRSSSGGQCEIVVKVLNAKQKIMTVSTLHFAASKKRRWATMAAS
jgi:hypothetical protein